VDVARQEVMRSAITIYCQRYSQDLQNDTLDSDDWQVINDTHNFLSTFNRATLLTQGDSATIDKVVHTMDIVTKVYKNETVC
jgi:CMP-N-acetylneuraminic acid synthetase